MPQTRRRAQPFLLPLLDSAGAGNLTSDGSCSPCWVYDDAGNLTGGDRSHGRKKSRCRCDLGYHSNRYALVRFVPSSISKRIKSFRMLVGLFCCIKQVRH